MQYFDSDHYFHSHYQGPHFIYHCCSSRQPISFSDDISRNIRYFAAYQFRHCISDDATSSHFIA
jgi:hypothetical protein